MRQSLIAAGMFLLTGGMVGCGTSSTQEKEIRKVYAEVVRGNVLSIVHRPSNRVVLQVVIYPQGDMAITHRFYMDLAKRLLKYCKEVYVDLYPNNRR